MEIKLGENKIWVDIAYEFGTPENKNFYRWIPVPHAKPSQRVVEDGENTVIELDCPTLNTLQGSEKQINWARDLRSNGIAYWFRKAENYGYDKLFEENNSEFATMEECIQFAANKALYEILHETSAKAIIEKYSRYSNLYKYK